MTDGQATVTPGAAVGFAGLGRMGWPMAARLAAAGYRVTGYDISRAAREAWAAETGSPVAADPAEAAAGSAAVVLMVPDSAAVCDLIGQPGFLGALAPGSVVVDMSSSVPQVTRELAVTVAASGAAMVDAPVSGGVTGARQGTLTVMAGGAPGDVSRVRPLLDVLGSRVLHVGDAGAGHAVKALNNLLSATHLLVTSEAMAAAARLGLDIPTVLDAINTSSGRSGSTENKWPNYIVPRSFASGFSLSLLLKDMRIALDLVESAGLPSHLSAAAVATWAEAAASLPADADHTEIARWLDPGLAPGA